MSIYASPSQVFEMLKAVEQWPTWTTSMASVKLEGGGSLQVGSKVRVEQPQLPPAVWKVTQCQPSKGFEWVSGNFLLRTTAGHWIEPAESGCKVILTVQFKGILCGYVVRKWGKLTEEYMEIEAQGLKAKCEQHQSDSGSPERRSERAQQ